MRTRKNLIDQIAGSARVPENKKGVPFELVLAVTKKNVAKKLAK